MKGVLSSPRMRAPLVPVTEAARRVASREAVLLDVREADELDIVKVEGSVWIPMSEIAQRVGEVPRGRPLLVMCHHGYRSQQVANWLAAQGFPAQNVAGGIDAWASQVDPSLAKY